MNADGQLSDLAAITPEIEAQLRRAEITTGAQLASSGAIGAFLSCIEESEEDAEPLAKDDWEFLYTLEAALRGVEPAELSQLDRDSVRADAEYALSLADF